MTRSTTSVEAPLLVGTRIRAYDGREIFRRRVVMIKSRENWSLIGCTVEALPFQQVENSSPTIHSYKYAYLVEDFLTAPECLAFVKEANRFNVGFGGQKELIVRGIPVGKERVRKLMKLHGIKARSKRKFKATTDSNHNLRIAPNLLDRQFAVGQPDRVWSSDITYLATDEGWLYLAVVIDLFSRQVVGWSMKPHMKTDLVTDALRMAWFRRHPEAGLVFHSDRGSQYCSHEFRAALSGYGMQSSMSRKGNCWDNAPTESLWGSLKVARIHGRRFETRRQAMDEVIDWLAFYNHRRLHSTLGYVSPMKFEENWLAAQNRLAA